MACRGTDRPKMAGCQEVGPLEAAAQVFVQEVTQGTPVPDAIATFCQEVLDGATVPVIADAEN